MVNSEKREKWQVENAQRRNLVQAGREQKALPGSRYLVVQQKRNAPVVAGSIRPPWWQRECSGSGSRWQEMKNRVQKRHARKRKMVPSQCARAAKGSSSRVEKDAQNEQTPSPPSRARKTPARGSLPEARACACAACPARSRRKETDISSSRVRQCAAACSSGKMRKGSRPPQWQSPCLAPFPPRSKRAAAQR